MAAELAPNETAAYQRKGFLLLSEGRLKEAEEAFSLAIERNDTDVISLQGLAQAEAAAGLAKAIESLNRTLTAYKRLVEADDNHKERQIEALLKKYESLYALSVKQ